MGQQAGNDGQARFACPCLPFSTSWPRPAGKLDIVPSRLRVCVFVHGCFGVIMLDVNMLSCTQVDFWAAKLQFNAERGLKVLPRLESYGRKDLAVWEFEPRYSEAGLLALLKHLRALSNCGRYPVSISAVRYVQKTSSSALKTLKTHGWHAHPPSPSLFR